MKVFCVFGKHQYGDPARGLGIEYAAFLPTLKRLGHQVIHFESWDRSKHRDFAELNRALLGAEARERPGVLLSVQTDIELWLETLALISTRGDVATVSWTTDDSWKYKQVPCFIGRYYHAMATTYPSAEAQYHRDGIRNVHLTQWAANAELLREPLPAAQCKCPVSFVGAAHGNRVRRVERLRARGIDVACFGHGWPNGPVAAEAVPEIMRQSVISLNFANARGDNQIKARTFEVPGAGGFLLSEAAVGIEGIYSVDQEIAVFRDEQELAEKIRHFLWHPAERDAIARAGFERTRRDHTYDLRLRELLAFALKAKDAWLQARQPSALLPFERCLDCHRLTPPLRALRAALLTICCAVWGKQRGPRAARRLVFEFSWRVLGGHTFTAKGLTGRLFPQL